METKADELLSLLARRERVKRERAALDQHAAALAETKRLLAENEGLLTAMIAGAVRSCPDGELLQLLANLEGLQGQTEDELSRSVLAAVAVEVRAALLASPVTTRRM